MLPRRGRQRQRILQGGKKMKAPAEVKWVWFLTTLACLGIVTSLANTGL
jgi:hypothetical protein